jgi:hypothetical protein
METEDPPFPPVDTFDVRGDLSSLQCEVRGGRMADVMAASLQMLVGPAYLVACWWMFRPLLRASPSPEEVGPLLLSTGFMGVTAALFGLLYATLVPAYVRWRVGFAAGLALMVGFAGCALGFPTVEAWGPAVVLWTEAVIAAGQLALRWSTPTSLTIDAHSVTVDDERLPLEGVTPRVDGQDLCIGSHRIPMGAHALWEREWLVERIEQVRAARGGEERVAEKAALGRLVSGRRQAE